MGAATLSAQHRSSARGRLRVRRALPLVSVAAMLSAALSLSPVAAGATPATSTAAAAAVSTTVDFSGDGHADLIGRTPTGVLYLHRGNGAGGFLGSRTVIGTGWQVYDRSSEQEKSAGEGLTN